MSYNTPEKRKAYYARNREKETARVRAYYARNREKETARARAHYARNREKSLARNLAYRESKRYGMFPGQYANMLAAQGGVCAICGNPPEEGGKRLHVDHDHDSGRVRGLLCQGCNTALGLLREDTNLLYKATEYLGGLAIDLPY